MTKPNFFIIGAPKCGTSSLAQWLRTHPNVFMSTPKEPYFYNTDFKNCPNFTIREYEKLFAGVNQEHKAVGEATTAYLRSEVAIPNILEEMPDAKFIVSLRNPIDMAYSWHRNLLYYNIENIKSFEEAWKAQEQRYQGERIPALCEDPKNNLLYGPICRTGEQLERLYQWCDESQVHIIFLEDIKKDPKEVYQKILRFLELSDDGRQNFPTINTAKENRWKTIGRVLRAIQIGRRRLSIPRGLRTGIGAYLNYLNRREIQKEPMREELRKSLQSYFHQDVEKLEELTGRNLEHWKS